MNNILRDEIELTDAELAEIYGAAGDDDGNDDDTESTPAPAPAVAPAPAPVVAPVVAPALVPAPRKVVIGGGEEEKKPCVDIFIVCEKCR